MVAEGSRSRGGRKPRNYKIKRESWMHDVRIALKKKIGNVHLASPHSPWDKTNEGLFMNDNQRG